MAFISKSNDLDLVGLSTQPTAHARFECREPLGTSREARCNMQNECVYAPFTDLYECDY